MKISAILLASLCLLAPILQAGTPQPLTSPGQVPEGLGKSDWASIHAAHSAWQHEFRQTEGGWQARNPGQHWSTRFDGRGFLTTPKDANWTWGMEFRSYGFGDHLIQVGGTPEVRASGQRLGYQWDENVEEWFVNDQRGLEHGFILKERPHGAAVGEALTFTMASIGPLKPSVSADAKTVYFRDAVGAPVLNYSGLKAWDAEGTILTSRFERGNDGQFHIAVEETHAVYPITIDPIAQQAYLKASNNGGSTNDWFGRDVAVSGDTVVVGAALEDSSTTGVNSIPNDGAEDSGAAYIFVRDGTTWSQQAYLKASNTKAEVLFGDSVAVSRDTVIVGVGAPFERSNASDSGAAYVFVRNGTSWSQQTCLKASNTEGYDWFGGDVAVSGDTVVVGASYEDSSTTGVNSTPNESASGSGAAYVFVRSGVSWSQQAYLKASNTGAGDHFGQSVTVSGDTIVVGADGEDSSTTGVNSTPNESAANSGAAYVFVRSGTSWSQQAYIKASNTGSSDYFGISVAVDGNTVVVGAHFEDSSTTGVNSSPNNSAPDSGAAYVFVRSGTSWSQQAYLKPLNTGASDVFGNSVAVSGDTVVVGASGEDSSTTGVNSTPNESASNSGAAYVFVRNGTSWSQQAYLKASNTGAEDRFGRYVAASGNSVIVSAPFEDSGTTGVNNTPNDSAKDTGAAYVFVRSGTIWSQQAFLKASNTPVDTGIDDGFGASVAVSGDTVIVGASGEDSSTTGVNSTPNDSASNSGAAYVFVRSGTSWSQQAYLKASNTEASDGFGSSVAVSGDIIIVGAGGEDSSTTGVNSTPNESAQQSGAAYVFVRSGSSWNQQAYIKASNTGVDDYFGGSVAVSGETVVVGAASEASSTTGVNSTPNNSAVDSGAAYVFVRSGTSWSQQAYLKASNTGAVDFFGSSVAVSGDTVVVGALNEGSSTSGVNSTPNESASGSGAAYVFVRSGTSWSQQAYLKASNTGLYDRFGWSVAVSENTVVVGAVEEDSGTTGVNSTPNESAEDSGAAYVFVRSGTSWSQQAYLKSSNTGAYDYFGGSVAVSGETVVVGASSEDSSTTGVNSTPNESAWDSGAAYVFVRSGSSWNQQAYLKTSNPEDQDNFGSSVALSGDTVVIGAPYEDSSTTGVNSTPDESASGSGAAYIFSGFGPALPELVIPAFTNAELSSSSLVSGSPYSATLTASGNPAPTFSVQSGTLPPGLSLNSTSGLLNGTPTSTGTFSGVFAATNSQGTATQAFSFTVNAPLAAPVFTSAALSPTILTGSPFTDTLTASGNPAPSFSVQSGTLPAGLSLNSTSGLLNGTPTSTGTFSGVFAATNSQGTATRAFSFTVNAPLAAPVFTSAALSPTILTGTSYSATLTASGNPAPTFSVQSGTLPTGLSLNSTSGLLNGTPTSTGSFGGVFAATNSQGTVTQAFSFTVNAPLAVPVFTSAALSPTILTGSPYSATLIASGNPAPTFSVQSGTLPPGLSLNSTSGVLNGTPTSTGTFSGVFAATNSQGTVTQAFSFTVNAPLAAPVFTSAALSPTILTSSPYSATLTASGNPAPTFSVQSGTLPPGLSLNSTSGVLNGTPTSTGTFSGVFAATNSQGTATQAFSFAVNTTYTVTFALGSNGTRIGGGSLTQTIAQGMAAMAPLVDANDFWVFAGWNATFVNITANLTVTALYEADDDNDGIGNSSDPDRDGDEMTDLWELDNFGNLTTAEVTPAGITDTDGDGTNDLDEFLAGTNPNVNEDALSIAQQAYLKASNIGESDFFGYSVAVSGETVVVGAWGEASSTSGVNSKPNDSAFAFGAAYVFVRNGTSWSQQAYLKASNPGRTDYFGASVAVDGNTVVIGASLEDSSTTGVNSTPNEDAENSGAAYVFVRSGTSWSQQAYLKASNTGAEDYFGSSVAVSGDTVVIGAPDENSSTTGVNSTPNNGQHGQGAAYVFVRSGTSWSQQAYLKDSHTTFRPQFGESVAVSGNTVVIGAPDENSSTTGVNSSPNESAYYSGAAYVFVRIGTSWSQQAYLKASNTGAYDEFGHSVAVSGDTVVIGARNEDSSTTGVNSTPNESAFDSGAAYVFVRSGQSWSQQAYLKASNTGAGDSFGKSVAVSGDTVVVGSVGEDSSTTGVNSTPNESASSSGAAYVFVRSGTSWSQQAYLKASHSIEGVTLGWSVAMSGDTVVVGVPYQNSSTTGANSTPNENAPGSGAAYIFTGLGPVVEGSEIALEAAGSDITTGSTQAFGSVATSAFLERVFTIQNTGSAALTLSGSPMVAISGSPDFTVTAQPVSPTRAPGSSTPFTVRFTPTGSGEKSATLTIASNDGDENPFVIHLTGTGSASTASILFAAAISSGSNLTGNDALPEATPYHDGVANLLKYAFNMKLDVPDVSTLTPSTGTGGLPAITIPDGAPAGTLRFEFLRRKGSGLVYAPQKSTTLDGAGWSPLTATPVVTTINDQWERVVYTEAPDPVPAPACFGRVEVSIP